MQDRSHLKPLSVVAFVAFMVVSCWTTSESLHLLLPNWPMFLFWVVTVGFYVISALGTNSSLTASTPVSMPGTGGRNRRSKTSTTGLKDEIPPLYLDELCYRFNGRHFGHETFDRLEVASIKYRPSFDPGL